jgi:hypothetical protein
MVDGHVDDVDPHALQPPTLRWLVRKAPPQATPRRMGLISYALQDVQSRNDELIELVNQRAEMIEPLETELDELRQRIEDR